MTPCNTLIGSSPPYWREIGVSERHEPRDTTASKVVVCGGWRVLRREGGAIVSGRYILLCAKREALL